MRELARNPWPYRCLSLALVLAACAPTARPVNSGAANSIGSSRDGGESGTSDEPSASSRGRNSVPSPPKARSVPDQHPALTRTISAGPQVCASERPDLSRVVIRFDLESELPPEELLLLSTWLSVAAKRAATNASIEWDGESCSGALLCAKASLDGAQKLIFALSQTVSDPPLSTLFSARSAALSEARRRDSESVEWRLIASSTALRRPGTYLEKALALRSEKPLTDETADIALERVLAGFTGAARLSALKSEALAQRLRDELPKLRVTIAGAISAQATLHTFSSAWSTGATSSKSTTSEDENQASSSPTGLIHLSDNADEWTHARLSWWNSTERTMTWIGIRVIVERLRLRAPTEVLLSQTDIQLFDSPLGLSIEGPYDQVVETALAADDEYQRIISLSGAPNASELKQAFLSLAKEQSKTLEPRCWPITPPAADARAIAKALRSSGPPLKVLWGIPGAHDSSESP